MFLSCYDYFGKVTIGVTMLIGATSSITCHFKNVYNINYYYIDYR
jgi:hypothetical protein